MFFFSSLSYIVFQCIQCDHFKFSVTWEIQIIYVK